MGGLQSKEGIELAGGGVKKMTDNNIFLSVVIPAYEEEKNILQGTAEKVFSYLQKQKYSWELIFVDDGSLDNTAKLLEEFTKKDNRIKLIKNPHQGKAATVATGMLAAKGQIVLFTDMDQATPIKEIEKFIPWFEEGYQIAIGSRNGREGAPLVRKLMAFGFVLLRTIILRLPFSDTQIGFKAFSYQATQDIFKSLKIFGKQGRINVPAVKAGFDLEILYTARCKGYKIKEVTVQWHHQGSRRVNPLRDSIDGLKDLLRIRWYAALGKYK